jgi:hypothetical protein
VLAGALLSAGALASGHGLDADRVELVLRADVAESVATPPVDFVRWADTDGDGRLTRAELDLRRAAVRDALIASLEIVDEAGRAGVVERADVSLPHGHDGDSAPGRTFLRVTVVRRWPAAPRALQVRCAFARGRPVTVYATRAEAATPGVLTLVGDPELARLASAAAAVTLLRAPSPRAPSPRAPSPRAPSPRAPRLVMAAMPLLALAFALARGRHALRKHFGRTP